MVKADGATPPANGEGPESATGGMPDVFCPNDGEFMPNHIKGLRLVRRCKVCGHEPEPQG